MNQWRYPRPSFLIRLIISNLAILFAFLPGGVENSSGSLHASGQSLQAGTWQPGTFEIHIFDVEQGDSQLILFPSGYSILIDVAEPSWNSHRGADLVAGKIRSITGGSHVNVGVITHLHLDHVGYAGYGGFWALIEEQGITFDKILDRDAGVWVDGSGGGSLDGLCDPDLEIAWHNVGDISTTTRRWLCYATDPANTDIYAWRELAQLSSTTQIEPPDANATVQIVQVDASGVMMKDGLTPVAGDHSGDSLPPSENDYSIALKVSYGTIDYATAGDADGEYTSSGSAYSYNDVESVNAARFGQVELLRVSHHGSSHSSNPSYIDTLNPDEAFISCGSNSYGHPDQSVLERLKATANVYLTNFCDATRDYRGTTIANGDIIIRSTDGSTYQVLVPGWVYLPFITNP